MSSRRSSASFATRTAALLELVPPHRREAMRSTGGKKALLALAAQNLDDIACIGRSRDFCRIYAVANLQRSTRKQHNKHTNNCTSVVQARTHVLPKNALVAAAGAGKV